MIVEPSWTPKVEAEEWDEFMEENKAFPDELWARRTVMKKWPWHPLYSAKARRKSFGRPIDDFVPENLESFTGRWARAP